MPLTSPSVVLPVVADKVLIFNLSDCRTLRDLGIFGVLSGTLSKAPQQNLFLGLPLQLSFNEVCWLVENEYGVLVDGYDYLTVESSAFHKEDPVSIEYTEELEIIHGSEKFKVITLENFIRMQGLSLEALRELLLRYHTFREVKRRGYCILPGLRFGGELLAYPGDPLRYHSHLIINTCNKSINILDLISGGRLATSVKKVWVINQVEDDVLDESGKPKDYSRIRNKSFSIEWAGFG